MRWAVGARAVIGAGLVLATLGGCGSGGSDPSTQESTAAAKPGFAVLPTRKCKTQVGYSTNPTPLTATTHAVLPRSVAGGLVAYRDSAGTTLIAPKGWDCEAIIGVDGGQRMSAYPPGHDDPAEYPTHSGEVVTLQLIPACRGCIADEVCALFPKAKVAQQYAAYGTKCPAKPLREQVTHISPSTVLFLDPPKVEGTGAGSGGDASSSGALSFTETTGVRKVSCTLSPDAAGACAGIVGATLAAAPIY